MSRITLAVTNHYGAPGNGDGDVHADSSNLNETLGLVQQAITYEPVFPPGTRNQVLTPEEPHIKDLLVSDDAAVATSAVPDDGELYEAASQALDAANVPLTGSTEDLYESLSAVAVASSAVPDDEDVCLDILNIDMAV